MALGSDSEFFSFNVSSNQTSSVKVEVPIYQSRRSAFSKTKANLHSGKIIKPRTSSLNLFSKSLFVHLQQPEFLRKHGVVNRAYYNPPSLLASRAMRDSEMSDVMENVYFERKLRDYTNHGFDQTVLVEERMIPNEVESCERSSSRFNSPVDEALSRSSKSPNSIEDLNKEIERLFLNNDKFEFTSFIWDKEEIAEGRRAPIADMLHCYKGYNRRKKLRSATALGIRNYNESDSSNGVSSPDDNSGCEEYTKIKLIESLDPPIVVPVPEKSGVDQIQTMNFSGPFSGNKLQLSEDSAFAPIRSSVQRPRSTPPQNPIDLVENEVF